MRGPGFGRRRRKGRPVVTSPDFYIFAHEYGEDPKKDLRMACSQLLSVLHARASRKCAGGVTTLEIALEQEYYRSKLFGRLQQAGVPKSLWFPAVNKLKETGHVRESQDFYTQPVFFLSLTRKGFDCFDAWQQKQGFSVHKQRTIPRESE